MSDDYAFYREQTIKLIREAGANEARLDGHDEAIDRIEKAVNDGFAHQENKTTEQINHIRGEIKNAVDILTVSLEDVKQERANFNRALNRVGLAVIVAIVAAALTQYAALSPQVAGMAAQALGTLQ